MRQGLKLVCWVCIQPEEPPMPDTATLSPGDPPFSRNTPEKQQEMAAGL